jgi:hypothetical protein
MVPPWSGHAAAANRGCAAVAGGGRSVGRACSLDTQSTDEIRDRHNGSRDRGVAIGWRSKDAGERELLSVDRNERSRLDRSHIKS